MRCFLVATLLLIAFRSTSQDYEWWRNNVQWDGTTHWREYITVSPRFMGPNAFPVPSLNRASLDSLSSLTINNYYHYMPGDQTFNPELILTYQPLPQRISMSLRWIPLEFYQTDHITLTERKVFFHEYDTRSATGDVYMETFLHFIRQKTLGVDVVNRIAFRFPTGNRLGAARFMDTPAYFFDLGIGRQMGSWRFMMMGGFLVWQTNQDTHLQNDAILYGLGIEKDWGPFSVILNWSGYAGYLDNGDRPAQLETSILYRSAHWQFGVTGRHGFQDNLYQTLGFSARRYFYLPSLKP